MSARAIMILALATLASNFYQAFQGGNVRGAEEIEYLG